MLQIEGVLAVGCAAPYPYHLVHFFIKKFPSVAAGP